MPASRTKPTGPRGLPFVGTSYMTRRDPMATLTRGAQQFGDIVHSHFFGLPIYFLVNPQRMGLFKRKCREAGE
jgi:hypothetical protein